MSDSTFNSQEACPAELPNFCAQRHWSIFWVLILCSLGVVASRIVTIQSVTDSDEPFYSANDRSRWATIRALGDHGTYQLDPVIEASDGRWDTIDKVRHPGQDLAFHDYSSKPTLMPTVLSGLYLAVRACTGWDFESQPAAVIRTVLLLFNGIGWLVFLVFFAKLINSVPVRDWARYYVLACAGFGTFLSTFAITLNNHLPAAITVTVALYLLSVIWRKPQQPSWYYGLTGAFAGLSVANELPALAFAGLVGLACLYQNWQRTCLAFLPGFLLVGAAFFGTNYLAHDTWRPAYSFRSDGAVLATVEGDFAAELDRGRLPDELRTQISTLADLADPVVEPNGWPGTPAEIQRWAVRDSAGTVQFAITCPQGDSTWSIRAWGNWYDYPGSYWSLANQDRKSKVDQGQASIEVYAFHLFFGHHGIFSLTPIWLLAFAGMVAFASGVKLAGRFQMRWLGWLTLIVTFVVLAFYLRRPEMDRNYGGVTCGLRWVFWLTPLWLTCMLPVVDWLGKTGWGKFVCYLLLLLSILSAGYANSNPWVHPWLYEIWESTGLPK